MWNIDELAEDVARLETKYQNAATGHVVFYGSSSIRLWPRLKADFPGVTIDNLGFGGSTLIGCAHYFQRLVVPRQPRGIVIFAGDNDIAHFDATPEQVWQALQSIFQQRDEHLGPIPTAVIELKPSPAREPVFPALREANEWLRREVASAENAWWVPIYDLMLDGDGNPQESLFMADRVHLSRAGYDIWNAALKREAPEALGL